MLTGDNPVTAEAVGRRHSSDEIKDGVPEDKVPRVRALQQSQSGWWPMAGAASTVAPALRRRPDVSIMMGSGTRTSR